VPNPTTVVPDPTTVVPNPITSDPLTPVTNPLTPVLGAATPQITEPVTASIPEPISPTAIVAQSLQPPLLEGASYSSSVAETQVAKTDGPLGSHPPLFDTSLLFSGHSLAALAAAALKDIPPRMPNPLFPSEFPSGTPPVGSTFRGGSGMGIGLELLAVLALLYTLSWIGGSSVSPREGFRLVSSPRLVTELPG
ncbi:MAG: hypothetical protein LC781_09035, partial [Actinobacteria bacterium]|nr:hypothetical protein [Actinomycetota bacterium]